MTISKDDRSPLLRSNGQSGNLYDTVANDRQIETHDSKLEKSVACVLIACVACINTLGGLLNGMMVVAIPTIARDLEIPPNLVLWPASIQALTQGCTLLICGSVADVLGSRPMFLMGCLLQFAFTLGGGLSRSAVEFIIVRGLAGIASSFCSPSAVSIVNSYFPNGRWRSSAFACMGGGQPVGFAMGLVVGGVSAGTIGWRWGFQIAAGVNFIILLLAAWKLPKNPVNSPCVSWIKLRSDIDWAGALIASTSLGLLFYVLAIVADESSNTLDMSNIITFSLGLSLLPVFVIWVGRQEKQGRPALIPNSLWRNKVFTSICINVFLAWGAFNTTLQFTDFFFQEVQHLSSLDTAIRFLPLSASGLLTSLFVGLFLHRIRVDHILLVAGLISATSPLLLALIDPSWSYWACAFPAIVLIPLGVDTLFTISILLISSVFPATMQGLAGGVFNTVSSIGKSMGLAVAASIANNISSTRHIQAEKKDAASLMAGYRGAFWFCFGSIVLTLFVGVVGLGKVGKLGDELGCGGEEGTESIYEE